MTRLVNVGDSSEAPSTGSSGYLSNTVDLSSATWNTVASHELFTVTGLVRVRLWAECSLTTTDTTNTGVVQLGYAGATDGFIAATDSDDLTTLDLWYDASPTTVIEATSTVVFDYVINGLDIGYEISGEALLTGGLIFHLVWEPLNATGAVVIGAGGSL